MQSKNLRNIIIIEVMLHVNRKDRNQDIPADIGIGIALKRHVLALPNMGTISNVNQSVINLLA